jgi:hypothetical protein
MLLQTAKQRVIILFLKAYNDVKNLTGLTVTPLACIQGACFRVCNEEQVSTLLENMPLGELKQIGRG